MFALSFPGVTNAVDVESRVSNEMRFGKWFLVEFTMPAAITYRIGTESTLPQLQQTISLDISPLNQCKPDKFIVNQFIGYKQMDFSGVPFIPIKYKVSGQSVQDSTTKPVVSDGFVFTPIEHLEASELLKARDKGNVSIWIQPPADDNSPEGKMFFPLRGFSSAYAKASQLCKENM